MTLKPALAEDAVLDKVIFPCWVQPKIDGVRALKLGDTLTGRSLDPFKGFGITEHFSRPEFTGLDGEMTLGDKPNSLDRLCSLTTGAMGRFKDVTEMADLHWWVFDLVLPSTVGLSYAERYDRLEFLPWESADQRLHLVTYKLCTTRHQLDDTIAAYFQDGYEGAIIRNPRAIYKPGRATLAGQELWRVKAWMDSEMLVTGITEGSVNNNEAKTNSLGRTERSSAKAGKVANQQVGSLQGVLCADVFSPVTGALMFKKGLEVTVGSGQMTVKEAAHYFENPSEVVGHVVKFKHFAHGQKDLPRMGTYISHRLVQDIS
jgi:DNA ligase-1